MAGKAGVLPPWGRNRVGTHTCIQVAAWALPHLQQGSDRGRTHLVLENHAAKIQDQLSTPPRAEEQVQMPASLIRVPTPTSGSRSWSQLPAKASAGGSSDEKVTGFLHAPPHHHRENSNQDPGCWLPAATGHSSVGTRGVREPEDRGWCSLYLSISNVWLKKFNLYEAADLEEVVCCPGVFFPMTTDTYTDRMASVKDAPNCLRKMELKERFTLVQKF